MYDAGRNRCSTHDMVVEQHDCDKRELAVALSLLGTYGQAGPPAFALLHEVEEVAAWTGAVFKKIFMENAMSDLCTTLCCGVAKQALASAPLRACLHVQPVLPWRPVPTEGLA